MKLSSTTLVLAAILVTPSAFASVLTVQPGAKQISGKTISKGGVLKVEDRSGVELTTVGAGLRKRFSLFSVYVGELLVNDKSKYVCKSDEALDSLKNLNAIAVRLQFLRAIGMSDLEKAFTDGFDNNEVDANDPAIKKFMAAVANGGDIANGAVLTFTGEKLEDGEAVTYENAKGQAVTVKGGAGFVRSIFSLWLGETGSDDGLKNLKEKLTNCQI